jgi:methylenetetrahydrofolate dehydrogenase (NADP+)/methenyltetrahydrofolate cyclohydrolase
MTTLPLLLVLKMKIDGQKIADEISVNLKSELDELKKRGIIPKLAIVLIGNDPISKTYVEQKEIKAKEIGIETITIELPDEISKEELKIKIDKLNNDTSFNGIIIQRPLPVQIGSTFATEIVNKAKDVDGFRNDSPFDSPISLAVLEALKVVSKNLDFLKTKNIVIIGKGETGGKPIIETFKKMGVNFNIIDTKTENPKDLISNADILISTVGKANVVETNQLKKGVVLIGVGMYKDESGEFQADYNQEGIENITSFYTPVPGGIGPLTVIMLLENVVFSSNT